MIANNAETLIKAMERDMNMSSFADTGNFTPSYATEPKNQDALYIKVTRLCM